MSVIIVRVHGTLARIDGKRSVLEPKSAKSRRTIPLSGPATEILDRVRECTERERVRAAQLWRHSCDCTAATSS